MAKEVKDINVKSVIINAAISAVATAATLYALNKMGIFSQNPTSGLAAASKAFVLLPAKVQARFADNNTMANASNPKWLIEQMANINVDDINYLKGINQKGIANMAFIALYGGNENARLKAMAVLEKIKNSLV